MKHIIALLCVLLLYVLPVSAQDSYASFYSPEKGVYVVEVDTAKCQDCVVPYVSDYVDTVESAAMKSGVSAAINAGFFDPRTNKTVSYVVINGQTVADPSQNADLMGNVSIAPFLDKILNRSEFRVLDCAEGPRYQIALHSTPAFEKCAIRHSIQAGPQILPTLNLEEEAFVVKQDDKVVRDSVGAYSRQARSVIAIKGQNVYIIAFSKQKKISLENLPEYLQPFGFESAMAFDGGSSTSLFVRKPFENFVINSAKEDKGRFVKSFLFVR